MVVCILLNEEQQVESRLSEQIEQFGREDSPNKQMIALQKDTQ